MKGNKPLLSILICTTIDRRQMFGLLYMELKKQCAKVKKIADVEILFIEDNKEISVGLKRQMLLEMSKGKYIVFFDSDDFPFDNYVSEIVKALLRKPDCVGFLIHMTTNGKHQQTCCHSLKYKEWKENINGYDYVRNVTHFNPVKRHLALKVGFKDMRFGEDKEYSDSVTKLCKKEIFVNKILFHYRYVNTQKHEERYGIK